MSLPGFPPRVCVLLIGDGRDDLKRATLQSWLDHREGADIVDTLVVDDRHHLLGFCGAIRYGWDRIRESRLDFDYVWHLEEDWLFTRPVPLDAMADLLDAKPNIAQVALRRGAEGAHEAAYGAPIEAFPLEFRDRDLREHKWLHHRLFWTTNPSLYRRELCTSYDWPAAPACEGAFTQQLVEDGASFAYWGDRRDDPWIIHTGTNRTGTGY